MGLSQRERQTEGEAGHLAQQLAAGIAVLERVGWGARSRLRTSFALIQTLIHAHSGHPSHFCQEVDSGDLRTE
jgi:hypothetical protein